jgi:hypothetical protein
MGEIGNGNGNGNGNGWVGRLPVWLQPAAVILDRFGLATALALVLAGLYVTDVRTTKAHLADHVAETRGQYQQVNADIRAAASIDIRLVNLLESIDRRLCRMESRTEDAKQSCDRPSR